MKNLPQNQTTNIKQFLQLNQRKSKQNPKQMWKFFFKQAIQFLHIKDILITRAYSSSIISTITEETLFNAETPINILQQIIHQITTITTTTTTLTTTTLSTTAELCIATSFILYCSYMYYQEYRKTHQDLKRLDNFIQYQEIQRQTQQILLFLFIVLTKNITPVL